MATSTANSNCKYQREDRSHEDAMQTTTASISAMASVAETSKQEIKGGQQKRVAGKCSDPLLASNTIPSQNERTMQPAAAIVRPHPESRSGRDGESELVTGVTIKPTLQASTANRRSQFMQETNPFSSGVMLCGCFEVEVHCIW